MPKKKIKKFETAGLLSYTILIDGKDVSSQTLVRSISVFKGVNKISTAELILEDGEIDEQEFELSNGNLFVPGNEIVIKIGYNQNVEHVFEGSVVSQRISANSKDTYLEIKCLTKNYAMTLNRKSNIYNDVTESDVLEEIIAKYNIIGDVSALNSSQVNLVQYQCTDWDFFVSRAQLNGCMAYQDGKKLVVAKPDVSKEPIQTLVLGVNIFSIQLEMDARIQNSSYSSRTWNFSDQEVEVIVGDKSSPDEAGNISPKKLSDNSHMATSDLVHGGSLSSEVLNKWVDANKQLHELGKITGNVKVPGHYAYEPLDCVEIEGVSDRFNGVHLITEVYHELNQGRWVTNLKLGVGSEWFEEPFRYNKKQPAIAMVPGINGLHIGTVTALEGDVEGEHRIQVRLPMVHSESEGIWARVSSPYAGNEIGIQFMPELGTEVLLGFLNDDPNQAVVLGGMHSQINVAPLPYTNDNFVKTIVSQSKLKIEFDDEKVACRIESPKGNKIHLDEDDGHLYLEDENGNKVILNSDGISITSSKDIVINAPGDIKCTAMNIEQNASAQFKAEGMLV